MGKIQKLIQRITRRLLGRCKSRESASGTLIESPEDHINRLIEQIFAFPSRSAEPIYSITAAQKHQQKRMQGHGTADPTARHVTAHYSIGTKSGRSCDGSHLVKLTVCRLIEGEAVKVVDKLADYVSVLAELGQAHDLTDDAYDFLVEQNCLWWGNYWIEIDLRIGKE